MAKILSLKLVEQPSHRRNGSGGDSHVCVFEAITDVPLPGDIVERFSQELIGPPLPATNPDGTRVNEIPNPGDRFFWSEDQGIVSEPPYSPGTTGIDEFIADAAYTGYKAYDIGSRALDFNTVQLEGGCNTAWSITVTFRVPLPGQNENPDQFTQLMAGRLSADQKKLISFTSPPLEKWVEQRPMQSLVGSAYPVTWTGVHPNRVYNVSTLLDPMRLPNYEEYPPVSMDDMVDVLVIAQNVENPNFATALNKAYYRTTNDAPVTLSGRVMPDYTAHYEVTRTGRPIYKDNSTYYRAETRIILFPEPSFIERQAFGSYWLFGRDNPGIPTKKNYLRDEAGMPLPRLPLQEDGDLADLTVDGSGIYEQTYSMQKPVSYTVWAD